MGAVAVMRREMEHTSGGPETLADEACVLTMDEWYAVREVMAWARARLQGQATRADAAGLVATAAGEWQDATEAALALAILDGAKERTFRSHFPLAFPPRQAVEQHATVNV